MLHKNAKLPCESLKLNRRGNFSTPHKLKCVGLMLVKKAYRLIKTYNRLAQEWYMRRKSTCDCTVRNQ